MDVENEDFFVIVPSHKGLAIFVFSSLSPSVGGHSPEQALIRIKKVALEA